MISSIGVLFEVSTIFLKAIQSSLISKSSSGLEFGNNDEIFVNIVFGSLPTISLKYLLYFCFKFDIAVSCLFLFLH